MKPEQNQIGNESEEGGAAFIVYANCYYAQELYARQTHAQERAQRADVPIPPLALYQAPSCRSER